MSGVNKKRKALLFAASAILFLLIGVEFYDQSFLDGNSTFQDLRYVNITLVAYLFSNKRINQPFYVYFPIPFDAENQKLISIKFSKEPDELLQDEWNQSIAAFKISSMEPNELIQISMSCIVKLVSLEYKIEPEKTGSIDDIPERIKQLYTKDEEMYKIHDPIIVSFTEEALGGEKNIYKIVRRIHDYVIERLSYKLDPRWDDAPTTLSKGEGSCSEYVFSFIALCRAAGVPARFVGGTVVDPGLSGMPINVELTDYTFHRWAEVYVPNYGWLPVDVTYDDGIEGNEFFFRLTDTFFAFVRRGGASRYLGWNYLPVIDPRMEGIVLRARAFWIPIPEAQKAVLTISMVEESLSHLIGVVNSSDFMKIEDLLTMALLELEQGNFTRGLSLSQHALSLVKELEENHKRKEDKPMNFALIFALVLLLLGIFVVFLRRKGKFK